MRLDTLRQLVQSELADIDELLLKKSVSNFVPLVNEIGHRIVESGGKRLRPLVLLLSAKSLGPVMPAHITLGVVIEFIHTATLLHDDVVDRSFVRRGQQTTNAIWGNEASVLVGDFLYSRAFQLMVEVKNMQVMHILANTTNIIAEGEVLQLTASHQLDTAEQQYLAIIERKTAKLFEAAAQLGGIEAPVGIQQTLASYGLNIGMAFQMIDDLLDFTGSTEEIGKNIGDDVTSGKLTLPLIYTLQHGTSEQKAFIQTIFQEKNLELLPALKETLQESGAFAYIHQLAEQYVKKSLQALEGLPDNSYRQALQDLAEFVVERNF